MSKQIAKTKVQTYEELRKQLELVGKSIGKSIKQEQKKKSFVHKNPLKFHDPKLYKQHCIKKLISDKEYQHNKNFGRKYRNIWKYMDEWVSTFAVRNILIGLNEAKIPKSSITVLSSLLEEVSHLRYETKYSGYNLGKKSRMQHPTEKNGGIFANTGETESVHNKLDRQRLEAVADAMEEELENKKATVQEVLYAGCRAAISFSLNMFDAPPTAKDIHVISKSMTQKQKEAITGKREQFKKIYISLGGTVENGADHSLNRGWGSRRKYYEKGSRSLSPFRIAKVKNTLKKQ